MIHRQIIKCVLFILLVSLLDVIAENSIYRIGGLFSDSMHQAAFRVLVNKVNNRYSNSPIEFIAEPYNTSYYNSLDARKGVCALMERGVIGVFGPSSPYTSKYIQAICDEKEIPQIEIHFDAKVDRNKCVINLHPHPEQIFQFFNYLIAYLGWDKVIILFEDNESLLRISPLLELNMELGIDLVFTQLDKDSAGSYRTVLNALKKSPYKNILLDCSIDVLEEVLTQAQQVGLMTDEYNFIITNLDISVIDLEPFQYGGVNITGV